MKVTSLKKIQAMSVEAPVIYVTADNIKQLFKEYPYMIDELDQADDQGNTGWHQLAQNQGPAMAELIIEGVIPVEKLGADFANRRRESPVFRLVESHPEGFKDIVLAHPEKRELLKLRSVLQTLMRSRVDIVLEIVKAIPEVIEETDFWHYSKVEDLAEIYRVTTRNNKLHLLFRAGVQIESSERKCNALLRCLTEEEILQAGDEIWAGFAKFFSGEVLKPLIKERPDLVCRKLSQVYEGGKTGWHLLARENASALEEMIETSPQLVEYFDLTDESGNTVWHELATHGVLVLCYIVENRPELIDKFDQVDSEGNNCWHTMAKQSGWFYRGLSKWPQVVQKLDQKNAAGDTGWHSLAYHNIDRLIDIVKASPELVDNLDKRDAKGNTVWHTAAEHHGEKLADILWQYPQLINKLDQENRAGENVWRTLIQHNPRALKKIVLLKPEWLDNLDQRPQEKDTLWFALVRKDPQVAAELLEQFPYKLRQLDVHSYGHVTGWDLLEYYPDQHQKLVEIRRTLPKGCHSEIVQGWNDLTSQESEAYA